MSQSASKLLESAERQQDQRRLLEYDAILANDSLGVLTICDGEVMQCNATAARIFGWDADQLLGQSAGTLFPSDTDFQNFASRIGDALAADGSPHVEWRCLRRSGEPIWCRLLVKGISAGGPAGETMWMVEDISSRKRTEADLAAAREELEQRVRDANKELAWSNEQLVAELYERSEFEDRARRSAMYDDLTGLPNRRLLERRLDEALRNHQIGGDRLAVLIIDFDEFAGLNDALGKRIGDEILRTAASRLLDTIRSSDLVARTGADEFAIVLGRLRHMDDAEKVARKLCELLSEPYVVDGEEIVLTLSVGASRFPADGANADMLLGNADAALKYARQRGRQAFQMFEPRMNADMLRRLQTESALRRALDNHEFVVHYQPRIDVATGQIIGAEALVRWQDPERGLQEPASFMRIAEDSGLIGPIGDFVLKEACAEAMRWSMAGLGQLGVSVNLSPREFGGRSLLPLVAQALNDTRLDASRLQIEITEASLMRDPEKAQEVLTGLQALGVRLCLDDFGTGYSSLSYLRRFPVHSFKIDGQFIRAVTEKAEDAKIVTAIAHLGSELGLKVVAESVETEGQFEFIKRCGCHEAQGYFLGRPTPADGFVRLLRPKS